MSGHKTSDLKTACVNIVFYSVHLGHGNKVYTAHIYTTQAAPIMSVKGVGRRRGRGNIATTLVSNCTEFFS